MSAMICSPSRRRSVGWLHLALLALIALSLALLVVPPSLVGAQDGARVDVVRVDGTITPVMARYVDRAIRRAEEDGAAAVVLEMDTPGGLSSAMDDIIRDILESEVPVVVYVGPRGARAASAGVYITYAAHVAAMAPGTNIGSASPVFIDGDGGVSDGSETLQRKVTNDAVSQIKNLAALRGRNAAWAEEAVREAANVTADEALSLGVIDLMAPDVPTLLDQIDGRTVTMNEGTTATLQTRGATLRDVDMSWMEQFLQLVADPSVAYILLSLGMLGLFLELSNPGVFLPGVVGGLFLLLGLFSLGTLPVNWAGVLLIGFAFLLFVVDLFVPSLGSLTVGGIISFVLGSYLLLGDAPPGYEIAPPVIWTMTACLVGFFLFIAGSVLQARLRPPYTGRQALLGEVGTVRQALNPRGMVYLRGALWQAAVDTPPVRGVATAEVPVGTPVVVTGIDGLRMTVRPATESEVETARRRDGKTARTIPIGGLGAGAEAVKPAK